MLLAESSVVITRVTLVVFLKQHSVWDVIGAFALAAILYPIVYVIPWGRKKQ